jgi:hypothetical protein
MKLFEIHGGREGAFSPETIHRLERIIKTKLGKIYRYGGETGVQHDAAGDLGYLYFFGSRAFRLDYTKHDRRIGYIDLWDEGASAVAGHVPDYQIELPADVSVFRILTQVTNFIKHPKVGEYPAKVDTNVKEAVEVASYQDLLEASRVSVEKFISAAKQWAMKNNKTDLLFTYPELKQVGAEYNMLLPGSFYDVGVGGRSDTHYDLARIEQDHTGAIITVHPPGQGHHFKFDASAPISKADQKALEQAIEPISAQELFDDLERLTKMVIKGARPSLVVIGGPGTGKTKTIMDCIHDAGLKKGSGWIQVKGKISPLTLYSTMFINRSKLLVFDDTDSLWENDDAVNILKAGLDSSPVRNVSWASPLTQAVTHMTDDEKNEYIKQVDDELKANASAKVKFPSEFDFTGRIIFISNKPHSGLDSAVLNRSMFIDMTLTSKQVFERIEGIMDKLSAPNSFDITIETKREVLEYLQEQIASKKMKYVSIRTFIGALGVASSGDPEWKRLLKYMGE